MDPVSMFQSEREVAQQAEDPMSQICTVANVDGDGIAHARTLVLRDVEGKLAIFVNATSPKWRYLQESFVVHTYWPSLQVQYRMRVTSSSISDRIVHDSWHMRPDPPKRMDWFYEHHGVQSSPIESREALLDRASRVKMPEPLHAPSNAKGLFIHPHEIERLDLTQAEGIHDRTLFHLNGSDWSTLVLVP